MTLFDAGHEEFRQRVRAFVAEHLTPHADEWESRRFFPREVIRAMGREGLLGLSHERKYGGLELDFLHNVVLAEELPRCRMGGLTLSILAQTNFCLPLLARHGTDQQKLQFLKPAIAGDLIGALASTEPAGGSDLTGATQCTARDAGDFWIVTGEKKFITNGPVADFVITLVRSKPASGTHSFSLLIIPTTTPGFRVKETLNKLGLHTSPTGWLEFAGCRVPKDLTLGRAHLGYFYHTQNLLEERLLASVVATSLGSLVFTDTIDYLRSRMAYGAPLTQLQAIRHRLSGIAAQLEMARRFVHSVCGSFSQGHVEEMAICMMKFQVIEIVQRVIEDCLQLNGGQGFLEENWISRAYRDARVLSLGGGSSEVMKDLVASYLRL